MNHNQLMTGVILAIILGLASFLLYRVFFSESQETSSAGLSDGAEIEQTLKKILAQTAGGVAAAGAPVAEGEVAVGASAAAPGAAAPSADLEKLRAELASNQKLVAELKASAASGGGGADQTPELLAKIKVLEDRLSEYEIIEDDIADLSIYKEENAKLKKELEALKGGAVLKNDAATSAIDAVAAAAPAAQAPAPTPEPTPASVDPGQVQTAVSTPAADAEVVAAQLMAQKAAASAPTPAPAPAVVAAPAAPAPAASTTVSSTENVQGSSDVFAEFQGGENADPLADLGDLDADRMLEEIKDLGEGAGDAGVLDEDVDLDKMAKETSTKG